MSKLHFVFGGRVKDPLGLDFVNLDEMDLVGLFDSYAEAEEAWRGRAQSSAHTCNTGCPSDPAARSRAGGASPCQGIAGHQGAARSAGQAPS